MLLGFETRNLTICDLKLWKLTVSCKLSVFFLFQRWTAHPKYYYYHYYINAICNITITIVILMIITTSISITIDLARPSRRLRFTRDEFEPTIVHHCFFFLCLIIISLFYCLFMSFMYVIYLCYYFMCLLYY